MLRSVVASVLVITSIVSVSNAQQGPALELLTGEGAREPAAALRLEAHAEVRGVLARMTLRQVFRNDHDATLDSVYVFPLPPDAAVTRLHVEIGDRVIDGVVKEKEQARQEFERASSEGRRAGLVAHERSNLFSASVAGVGPHELVTVEIGWQEVLALDGDRVELSLPVAITPRYGSTAEPSAAVTAPVGLPELTLDAGRGLTLDANELTLDAGPELTLDAVPELTLDADIDAGVAVEGVSSPSHRIEVTNEGPTRRRVRLPAGTHADADLRLDWTLAPRSMPQATAFVEHDADADHVLALVVPPAAAGASVLPRDVVFVIDVSGSMQGEPIGQAKSALQQAIGELAPDDRFDVIAFETDVHPLWSEVRVAGDEEREQASSWVGELDAGGGTNMEPALELALGGATEPGRLKQVVFLTDGAVENEDALFSLIESRLGASRLFTVGIGSAPNASFMVRAAEAGRGTFTSIANGAELAQRVSELFEKLREPVLRDVQAVWPDGAKADAWPSPIPDAYAGRALVVVAEIPKAHGVLRLAGRRANEAWSQDVDLDAATEAEGIGALWARARIDGLQDAIRRGGPEDVLRPEIVALSVKHGVVSSYASLVAVESEPSFDPAADRVARVASAPAPASFGMPRTATGFRAAMGAGLALLVLGAALRRVEAS
jgi:Ca-activated chloride channel family protein